MSIVIIGSGGQAKVIISTLLALNYKILGLVDDNPACRGHSVLGIPVIGDQTILQDFPGMKAICGIGNNALRQSISQKYDIEWLTVIHPQAIVHESVVMGVGTVVFAGAIIQPDAIIGDHAIINTGATIDHDCHIGDFCHIAPGAHLGGNVLVNDGVFLGIGTIVKPGMNIGAWSTLGAGSVVVDDIPDSVVAMGVPAKIYKTKLEAAI